MSWQPTPIDGLRWIEAHDALPRWTCAFLPSATMRTAEALLERIPCGGSLQFLDSLYHGRPAAGDLDPGAIFCVFRDAQGELSITCGNHGWSSRTWQPVELQVLARFLFESRGSNAGPRAHGERSAPGEAPACDAMSLYLRAHHRPRPGEIDPGTNLLIRRDRGAS